MGVFKVNLLDYYFSEQHELSSFNAGHNLIEKFFNMKIFKDIREKYPDIINPSLQNRNNLGDRPVQEDLIEFKKAIEQQPRLKSFLMDVVKCSHENINEMWKYFYSYDEFLFKHYSIMMNFAKEEDIAPLLLKIIKKFQKKRKNGLSLFQQIQSPLDISEVKTEARLKIEAQSFTFRDIDSKRWDIIQRLNQKSIYEQQINVHNWCKELGFLLEDQFKRTIYFIFLINHLIKTRKAYAEPTNLKFLSIHNVLILLSKDFKRYKNFSKLHHIRNSIHHTTFTWESSEPIENSSIRYVDKAWVKTVSFNQLLNIYLKLVTFVATFELVVMNTQFSLLDDSRPIDQILRDVGNQLFQQNPLREWLNESEDDQ